MNKENEPRLRLVSLLRELFQLDEPDLDFGFYRIMHAKSDEVSKFIEEDLLGIIQKTFGEEDESLIAEKKEAYKRAIRQAKEFGVADPEATEPVKKAKEAYLVAENRTSAESQVYDHLFRFFERYFDNGDFMSRRYFLRESEDRASPYAVPYDGRDVFLHWANRDQYYIKTAEYLTNFTFDPSNAPEYKELHGKLLQSTPLKVHCRIVSGTEGEHNNARESEQSVRFFIIHKKEPLKLEIGDNGYKELVIQFEYRSDGEKIGHNATWRTRRIEEASSTIKTALSNMEGGSDFYRALLTAAPTEMKKERTLLDKYLSRYTSRNEVDYFIHKDLSGFLRRELDFYIKNEVMRLDDIVTAEAPSVESYLAKIKVLRKIANQIIEFLGQVEDFQRRLWLKKKFVVDVEYCITLDRIRDDFFTEIAMNEAQRKEWVKQFRINELNGYSEPLLVDFLKVNNSLPVDTVFFDRQFKEKILAEIDDLDDQQVGTLFHSNNASALSLIQRKYSQTAKVVYIDPPYNTDSNSILYKNSYRHSSWLTMMYPLLVQSKKLELNQYGVHAISIDKAEISNLMQILKELFGGKEIVPISVIHNPGGTMGKNFSGTGEFCVFVFDDQRKCIALEDRAESPDVRDFMNTAKGSTGNHLRHTGKTCFYPIYVKGNQVLGVGNVEHDESHPPRNKILEDGTIAVYPIDYDGEERKWVLGRETVEKQLHELTVKEDARTGTMRIVRTKSRINYKTVWTKRDYSAKKYGTELLGHMIPLTRKMDPLYPKSIHLVKDILTAALGEVEDGLIIDYFAGSGTTGDSVLKINKELGKNHKFVLAEMGGHFDSVLRQRILKSAYSSEWTEGKPVARDGTSIVLKYIRLESYEDSLNNLSFRKSALPLGETDFRQKYMLRYWLDYETKSSPTMLNLEKFCDPTDYIIRVKRANSEEYIEKNVDLIETFNWLIGLHVVHLDKWRRYFGSFKREVDRELPGDVNTRLSLEDDLREMNEGKWQIRKIEGYTYSSPGDKNSYERTLVIWRKLTGELEQDNLILDEWFKKFRSSERYSEFDVIYVNGSNNLMNIRTRKENWNVRLIEETFHKTMWDVEG